MLNFKKMEKNEIKKRAEFVFKLYKTFFSSFYYSLFFQFIFSIGNVIINNSLRRNEAGLSHACISDMR